MPTTEVRPDPRTPAQIAADERVAAGDWTGFEMTEVVPAAERWAVVGVLFAKHLGFAKNFHRQHLLLWEERFRQDLVVRRPDLRLLLEAAPELTPEIEAAVSAAARDFRPRFRFI